MGQCYTVEAKLNFKNGDPAEFCKICKDEISAIKNAVFDLTRGDLDEPFGCFKILTAKDAWEDDRGVWLADFSGSYGWEWVMFKVFKAAAEALEEGSFIYIYPDDGVTIIRVRNGNVVVR